MPLIKIMQGEKAVGTYEIDSNFITVGRSRDNVVCIANLSVSRFHCIISCKADGTYVKDLGSRNGTVVNNRPVSQCTVAYGDIVAVGAYSLQLLDPAAMGAPVREPEFLSDDTATPAGENRPVAHVLVGDSEAREKNDGAEIQMAGTAVEDAPPDEKEHSPAEMPLSHAGNSKSEVPAPATIALPHQSTQAEDTIDIADSPPHTATIKIELNKQWVPIRIHIRNIIAEYGPVSFFKIKRLLRLPEFGCMNIGLFKLRRELKNANLETKAKRERYYRSC
jgi:pSer/pThr/pTyr-binding forkhead associated (FHA) protein